jgi:hypothetical protein
MNRSGLPNAIVKYQPAGKMKAGRHVRWIVTEIGTGHEARVIERVIVMLMLIL